MKIRLIAVGRLTVPYVREGCAEYLQRLRRYFEVETVELKDAARRRGGSPTRWKEEEARSMLARVSRSGTRVALDEQGRQMTSRDFASWLARARDGGVSEVAFLVGGPDGLADRVRQDAHLVLSLGRLTLPHELARLVLIEQLYRVGTILAGHPYHR